MVTASSFLNEPLCLARFSVSQCAVLNIRCRKRADSVCIHSDSSSSVLSYMTRDVVFGFVDVSRTSRICRFEVKGNQFLYFYTLSCSGQFWRKHQGLASRCKACHRFMDSLGRAAETVGSLHNTNHVPGGDIAGRRTLLPSRCSVRNLSAGLLPGGSWGDLRCIGQLEGGVQTCLFQVCSTLIC